MFDSAQNFSNGERIIATNLKPREDCRSSFLLNLKTRHEGGAYFVGTGASENPRASLERLT